MFVFALTMCLIIGMSIVASWVLYYSIFPKVGNFKTNVTPKSPLEKIFGM